MRMIMYVLLLLFHEITHKFSLVLIYNFHHSHHNQELIALSETPINGNNLAFIANFYVLSQNSGIFP